jgi:hypothetical protein
MRHNISVDSAIADDWEVEPEVYEVECVSLNVSQHCPCDPKRDGFFTLDTRTVNGDINLFPLHGRRCAITIKPLD